MPLRYGANVLVFLSGKGAEKMTSEQEQLSGTLIRGADGTLYFIPRDQLEACRVPDNELDIVKGRLETGGGNEFTFSQSELELVSDVVVAPGFIIAMCSARQQTSE